MTLDQGYWIGIGLFLCCLGGVFWYAFTFSREEDPIVEQKRSAWAPPQAAGTERRRVS